MSFSPIPFTPSTQSLTINQHPCVLSEIQIVGVDMKFDKILKSLIEQTLPDWRDKFLCYKILKKQLNVMCPEHGTPQLDAKELIHFLNLLQLEIDKFNTFFIDKEEEYVIKWKELQDKVVEALDSNVDLMSLGREIVDFHGEMVLLENYSALNYTGMLCFKSPCMNATIDCLVKIIKKHDKKTGALLRTPFIQEVVTQPFFEIDVLKKLVKECEMILSILFTNAPSSSISQDFVENGFESVSVNENRENVMQVPDELAEIKNMKNMYIELTLSALHALEKIRGRSPTALRGYELLSCFGLTFALPHDEMVGKYATYMYDAMKKGELPQCHLLCRLE
ncbi:hypothetical protein Fmac_023285 [Flemingia macrophylla]|uniref:SPX domain-containing protein n=1 Tax=Flemingia macrophylla TaxID=520843 RepID=A0ABD1LL39_9FABA